MAEFRMPSLGADMEAGTLVEWNVRPGDPVKRGQVVAVVETAKGAVEIEVWQDGVVDELVVGTGTKVPVGTVIARLRAPGEEKPEAPPLAAPPPSVEVAVPPPPPTAAPATRAHASPAARKRARERGVDLDAVAGTGPGGVVTLADVDRAAQPAEPAAHEPDRRAAMRKAIAAAMSRSKREIPHYYLATDVDMSRALAWLRDENGKRPVTERILCAVVELKAVALALRQVPELAGFWIDDAFRPALDIHLGVAISLRGGGLVAPALHDVDRKDLGQLMRDLADLTERARAGSLRSSEMTDPVVTVTNLGEKGVETVFGVIYPPQVALVGLGRISERPWAEGGMVGARPVLTATLAADHRASDGHRGGAFLASLSRLLQEPEKL